MGKYIEIGFTQTGGDCGTLLTGVNSKGSEQWRKRNERDELGFKIKEFWCITKELVKEKVKKEIYVHFFLKVFGMSWIRKTGFKPFLKSMWYSYYRSHDEMITYHWHIFTLTIARKVEHND